MSGGWMLRWRRHDQTSDGRPGEPMTDEPAMRAPMMSGPGNVAWGGGGAIRLGTAGVPIDRQGHVAPFAVPPGERPGRHQGRRLPIVAHGGQTRFPATMSLRRVLPPILLPLVLLALVGLAACGTKGPPEPPGPPDKITYPRIYPTR